MSNDLANLPTERAPMTPIGPDDAWLDRTFASLWSISLLTHMMIAGAAIWISDNPTSAGVVEFEPISISIVSESAVASMRPATSGDDASPALPTVEQMATPAEPAATVAPSELPSPATESEPTAMIARSEPPREQRRDAAAAVYDAIERDATAAQPAKPSTAPLSIGGEAADLASASQAAIEEHARQVALEVARQRPQGIGLKGKVVVELKLSPQDGSIVGVSITSTSGDPRLDLLAKSAVERGRYSKPPAGMRSEHLVYRIPFEFD